MDALIYSCEKCLNLKGFCVGCPLYCALSSVVEHIVHTDGVVGSNPAVRTIYRRLEKRLVSSPFMLMHKRAYSNDNRVFVLPALN